MSLSLSTLSSAEHVGPDVIVSDDLDRQCSDPKAILSGAAGLDPTLGLIRTCPATYATKCVECVDFSLPHDTPERHARPHFSSSEH